MMRFCRAVLLAFTLSAFAATSIAPDIAWAKTQKTSSAKVIKVGKSAKKSSRAKVIKKKRYSKRNRGHAAQPKPFSALVVNADNGHVIYEKNAGNVRYPASLTKMMTLYLTFDALKNGKLSLDEDMPVSMKAASQPQTNIALDPGTRLPVRTAIESVVVRSANDSAMVLAEKLGGTEWNFALLMTQKARELGMTNTVFRNPNGLPDNSQHTTAFDMARLAIALRRDFPEYYHFFSLQSFDYNGITYPGHNRVMERYEGADGVKTGYIRASGFNLVTSVKKNGYSIVAVIMGGQSAPARDNQMIDMLDRTFDQLGEHGKGVATKKSDDEDSSSSMTLESIAANHQG